MTVKNRKSGLFVVKVIQLTFKIGLAALNAIATFASDSRFQTSLSSNGSIAPAQK